MITGQSDYTIIDVQLNRNVTDSDVNTIRQMAGTDVIFSEEHMGNESYGKNQTIWSVSCNRPKYKAAYENDHRRSIGLYDFRNYLRNDFLKISIRNNDKP